MKDKRIGSVENGVYVITEDIANITNGTRWAENVPACEGGILDGVYSAGDGSFVVCINECKRQDLLDYADRLEARGYGRYSQNEMGRNLFFTYENGENYVYAYFVESTASIRVIAEPFYRYVDFTPERDLVKPAVIASSACDRNFYVRLPDNTLVVIDGGWRMEDRSRYEDADLLKMMYEEMRQILGGEEIIKVSLWIITHAHSDHARVLEMLHTLPLAEKFEIVQILYNFPCNRHLAEQGEATSPEQYREMQENLERWHRDAGVKFPYERIFYNCPFRVYDTKRYENVCREAFGKYGAIQIKAHDGMKLSLSGVLFEVIHTQEDDMPAMFDNNNNISIAIKMTYRGSSMLWIGDMCEIPSDSCVKMYGDFLKSDGLQVSHHGWNAATPAFYEAVKPSVLFWSNSEFGFKYADRKQGYGKTKPSTDLYHMDCVKKNFFCNRIDMAYVELPVVIEEEIPDPDDCQIFASGVSDRIFLIRLPDHRLIVIDGGWRREFWEEFGRDCLIGRLYGEMKKIVGEETVTVAAWFVTNSYRHNTRFLEEYPDTEVADRIRIERIVCNCPPIECYVNYDSGRTESFLPDRVFARTGAEIVTAHTGDTYEIGAVRARILYAPDEGRFENVADSSLAFRLTYGEQSVIFTGDMTDRISRLLLRTHREELPCEVVQVANHGWNNCGVPEFYETCGARVQLWNNSEYGYRFFRRDEGYQKTEASTGVYHLKTCERNVFCDCVSPQMVALSQKK